jgi:hypothetical protein
VEHDLQAHAAAYEVDTAADGANESFSGCAKHTASTVIPHARTALLLFFYLAYNCMPDSWCQAVFKYYINKKSFFYLEWKVWYLRAVKGSQF